MKQPSSRSKVRSVTLLSDAEAIERIANELTPFYALFQYWGCAKASQHILAARQELFRFAKQADLQPAKVRSEKGKKYG